MVEVDASSVLSLLFDDANRLGDHVSIGSDRPPVVVSFEVHGAPSGHLLVPVPRITGRFVSTSTP